MANEARNTPSPPGWRPPVLDVEAGDLAQQADQVLEAALERLRWCREHILERGVSQELRQIENRIGYLAQALTWEMEGETVRTAGALRLARGLTREPTYAELHPYEYDWWNSH
jgi:hypothetical protein